MTVAEYAAAHGMKEQVLRNKLRELTKFTAWRETLEKAKAIDEEIAAIKKSLGDAYIRHEMVGKSYLIFVK